ncbi:MAG TPA: hypothetical protein PKE06_10245, partial [Flavilitoribacter sp.]|nr:hypothetical protein [Flavilitoribacter sp.]
MVSIIKMGKADLQGANPDANSGPESDFRGNYGRSNGSADEESVLQILEWWGPGRRDNSRPGKASLILSRQDFNKTAAGKGPVNLNG